MRIVCCNGSRTPNTKHEWMYQCPECESVWHEGCISGGISNGNCCGGKRWIVVAENSTEFERRGLDKA